MRFRHFTLAALALLLGLAACTQKEPTNSLLLEDVAGTPIVFTATGLSSNTATTAATGTRATVDGDWDGVSYVGIMIDGTVKKYTVTADAVDNTTASLSSDDPHYWSTNHDNLSVTAWWPYTDGETEPPVVLVQANQSTADDFAASDFISAEQTVSYGNTALEFTHRTARVIVELTDYTEELKFVKLMNLSDDNGNSTEIVPYKYDEESYTSTYVALVAPQTVAQGTAFIAFEFENGNTFFYVMQEADEWNAGGKYTYTVSLADVGSGYIYEESTSTYMVYNARGLQYVAGLVNSGETTIDITLVEDIDLTSTTWTPIGNNSYQYTGTFEGGGHTITGLTFNQSETNYVGLIGCLGSGGKVQNLTLDNVNITGYDRVGGVVGQNSSGTVTNCSVSGNVSGNQRVGGVVGENVTGTVTACYSTGSVSGGASVGGVVGWNQSTMTACYSTGSVSGTNEVGGVIGYNYSGTVTACYHALDSVSGSGSNYVGGVIGYNSSGTTVTACYWSDYEGNGLGSGSGSATKVGSEDCATWIVAQEAMNTALANADSEWRYENAGASANASDAPTLTKSSSSE